MTKPIIVVKMPCKLLYVIQVKGFLIKCSTSWPSLLDISFWSLITIVASDWPHIFLQPDCFCLAFTFTSWALEGVHRGLACIGCAYPKPGDLKNQTA